MCKFMHTYTNTCPPLTTHTHAGPHMLQYTNGHLSQFQLQLLTPVCQSSNAVLLAIPWPICVCTHPWAVCVNMSKCVYVCVLEVWRQKIRWQSSYHPEPTCPKPSQTSGVTSCWLFPKHSFIFMSVLHQTALIGLWNPSLCLQLLICQPVLYW